MNVYLVRHAIAERRVEDSNVDDAERPLTGSGIRRFRRCVLALSALKVQLDEIWTSPLRRARQTAELLARLDAFEGDVRVVEALRPGGEVCELTAALRECAGPAGVALVGHEPDLGRLVGLVLTGGEVVPVAFKKGGVACLELTQVEPAVRGRLCWLLTPNHMRRMD